MKNTVKIRTAWDGDAMSYVVYVNGKLESAHWTYEEAEEEANRIKAEQEDTDMTAIDKAIKTLNDNNILADVYESDDQICVDIEWGDWKHDHAQVDALLSTNGFTLVGEEVTEEDGSDCYSATHYFTYEEDNKEDTTMTESKAITFEVNGTIYNSNEKGNRFYKTIGTKKVRISEAEWDEAMDAYACTMVDTPEFGSTTEPNSQEEERMAEEALWEMEADAEKQAREDKAEADAKQAEEAVAKKTKKKSKKNVAFTFEDADGIVTLTEKQVRFLTLLPNDDFYEHGLESTLWIDVLCDTLAGEFNPMALGAMVSTLREKYLISVGTQKVNGKKCKYFAFTELGKRVASKLGLN